MWETDLPERLSSTHILGNEASRKSMNLMGRGVIYHHKIVMRSSMVNAYDEIILYMTLERDQPNRDDIAQFNKKIINANLYRIGIFNNIGK